MSSFPFERKRVEESNKDHRPDCGCKECWPVDRLHHPHCCGHCYMCGGCMDGKYEDEPPTCSVCG